VDQQGAPAKGEVAAAAAAQAAAPAQPDPYGRAPASWKAGAREAWTKLPPEVRTEVYRRERETAVTLQQSAQARQVAGALQQMQQEFANVLSAEGVDALTASRNIMREVGRLRFGNQVEKAQTIHALIEAYGVDIATLDAVLANAPIPQQAQQRELRDPRVDGLLSQLAQQRQQAVYAVRREAAEEVSAFGQQREFFNDVRETMADLMEMAYRRGVDLPMEQAYVRACQMDPEISRVIAQRAAAGAAQNGSPSTARNRAAAGSIRSTPAASVAGARAENLRDAISDAWDQAAGS
jgi:hypothetical protein